MKKLAIIIALFVVIGGAALYFFMFSGEQEKPEVRVAYSPGEYFTTNVKESSRLLKTTVVLIVNEEGLEEMLKKENARIRDTIVFILRDLKEEDIKGTGTKDELRERIIAELNERLGIDNFVEVLFNDFVMA
jgi:flagellar basal body-associated protein FliL